MQIREHSPVMTHPTGVTKSYKCGHCGEATAGVVVSQYRDETSQWIACPGCKNGSVSNYNVISPSPLAGEDVKKLPKAVKDAYTEARKCFSIGCYTACALMCRKILMNVSSSKGADEGLGFVEYIEYLDEERFIPTTMKTRVKQIKDHGNAAAHKIETPDPKMAEYILDLTAYLLKGVYEMDEPSKEDSTNGTCAN